MWIRELIRSMHVVIIHAMMIITNPRLSIKRPTAFLCLHATKIMNSTDVPMLSIQSQS